MSSASASVRRCDPCRVNVPSTDWDAHTHSSTHIRRVAFDAALEAAKRNRGEVTVSESGTDFGIVAPEDARSRLTRVLDVQSTNPSIRTRLLQPQISSVVAGNRSPFSVLVQGSDRDLPPGRVVHLTIIFQSEHRGHFLDNVEVVLENAVSGTRLVIVRTVRATVGDPADHALLQAAAPYRRPQRRHRNQETEIVPGEKPPSLMIIPYTKKLPRSPVPKSYDEYLRGDLGDVVRRFRDLVLPTNFNTKNCGMWWKVLLWTEEVRADRDLQVYDMEDVAMTKERGMYWLNVPGLAENRPSVVIGDRILVQKQGGPQGRWYEGFVYAVELLSVGLKFNFGSPSPTQRYHVRFKLNRIPFQRQHQALNIIVPEVLERISFPSVERTDGLSRPGGNIVVYNKQIVGNEPQVQAIVSVLKQAPGSLPVVIFGPPGTGKTVTMVETIRQILKKNPNTHILACAPSNSAADLVAIRLSMLSETELFRFYAPSRTESAVPPELKRFTFTKKLPHPIGGREHALSVPSLDILRCFKVIVTTCGSSSVVYGVGVPRGHFSHIFFDEAGQAMEPEVMVAIRTMADAKTNVVLSGDPKQLGPIIRSPVARELGLGRSYLERLMDMPLYKEARFRGITYVKLVKNFRSHPSILAFPNERFYEDELIPAGDPALINSFIGSSLLPRRKFPIVFHAVQGKDEREASSPSFFNISEIEEIKFYVQLLKARTQPTIDDKDIGVIAPYNAQCRKIRQILKSFAPDVSVGSVEQIQGQERRVILISTVRSSRDFVDYDLKHTLGFVANPRRFNVAVTRAQALLIVVGDPSVLGMDPLWRAFLNYVSKNGGWKGPDIPWNPHEPVREDGEYDRDIREAAISDMNEFTRRMQAMTLESLEEEMDANVADRAPLIELE